MVVMGEEEGSYQNGRRLFLKRSHAGGDQRWEEGIVGVGGPFQNSMQPLEEWTDFFLIN